VNFKKFRDGDIQACGLSMTIVGHSPLFGQSRTASGPPQSRHRQPGLVGPVRAKARQCFVEKSATKQFYRPMKPFGGPDAARRNLAPAATVSCQNLNWRGWIKNNPDSCQEACPGPHQANQSELKGQKPADCTREQQRRFRQLSVRILQFASNFVGTLFCAWTLRAISCVAAACSSTAARREV
jgi:hypothetical protein